MKAFIDCDCEILQKTLELFLKDHAASAQDCDFVISDEPQSSAKPLFLIGEDGDLALPFSKNTLLSKLEDFQGSLKQDLANMMRRKRKFARYLMSLRQESSKF